MNFNVKTNSWVFVDDFGNEYSIHIYELQNPYMQNEVY